MREQTTTKTQKFSEIFLHYVAPLSRDAPKDIEPEKLQHAFIVPVTIWNALVMKQWGKETDYLKMIQDEILKNFPPELAKLMEPMVLMWVKRKEELFPDEHWAIEEALVYRDFKGEVIVRVIARGAEEIKPGLSTQKPTQDYRSSLN